MEELTKIDFVLLLGLSLGCTLLGYLLGRWQANRRAEGIRIAALHKQETIDALRWELTQGATQR